MHAWRLFIDPMDVDSFDCVIRHLRRRCSPAAPKARVSGASWRFLAGGGGPA